MTREGYKIVRLGDVCKIGRGSSPRPISDQKYFEGGNIPWIKIADATKSGKFLYETKEYVNEYGASFSRILPKGSLIMATSGTLGYVQRLGVDGCIHDGRIYFLDYEGIDDEYLYYGLISKKEHLFDQAYGAAIQNINIEIVRNITFDLPPLAEQQRIASILSAYDDLIENNTRRIALLEQTAQTLYRQWFIEYKFPGYQDVKMIESGTEFGMIPQGWEVKKNLKDLITINKGISYKSSELSETEGVHFVNLKCFVRGGGFRNDGIKKYTGLFKSEKVIHPGDLVMAVTDMTQAREIVARVAMVPDLDGEITMSCDVVKIVPQNIDKTYLYYMLRFSGFSDTIKEMANGANVLHLRPDSIYEYPIIIPSKSITEVFKNHCGVIVNEMGSLEKQNQSLKEQRDILLRKLIG